MAENHTATMQDAARVHPPTTSRNAAALWANPDAGDEATVQACLVAPRGPCTLRRCSGRRGCICPTSTAAPNAAPPRQHQQPASRPPQPHERPPSPRKPRQPRPRAVAGGDEGLLQSSLSNLLYKENPYSCKKFQRRIKSRPRISAQAADASSVEGFAVAIGLDPSVRARPGPFSVISRAVL